jgi:hypothetical protein
MQIPAFTLATRLMPRQYKPYEKYLKLKEAVSFIKLSLVVFWIVTAYGLVGGYKRFEETCHGEDRGDIFLRNVGTITYKTARCHNPEDHNRQLHRRENLRFPE